MMQDHPIVAGFNGIVRSLALLIVLGATTLMVFWQIDVPDAWWGVVGGVIGYFFVAGRADATEVRLTNALKNSVPVEPERPRMGVAPPPSEPAAPLLRMDRGGRA